MIGIQKLPDDAVDVLLDGEAEGEPDAHSLYRVAVINDLPRHQQLMVPLAEVLFGRKLGALPAGFPFAFVLSIWICHATLDMIKGVIKVSMAAAKRSRGIIQRRRK